MHAYLTAVVLKPGVTEAEFIAAVQRFVPFGGASEGFSFEGFDLFPIDTDDFEEPDTEAAIVREDDDGEDE
jgi:hypothetical protein